MELRESGYIYHPFLDPQSPYYEGSTERKFASLKSKDACKVKHGTKKCNLQKGHKGQHEYWQFPEDMTNEELLNGRTIVKGNEEDGYQTTHIEPWNLGMRTRTWKKR